MGFGGYMIDKLKANIPLVVVAVAVLAFAGLLAYNTSKSSNSGKSEITVTEDQKGTDKTSQKTPKQYTFTAEDGDSYTVFARRAVQSYTKTEGVKLQSSQIIAAETMLAQDAGSPLLDVGQKVTIKTTDVHNAVKKAQALSAEDLAAWETYVPYVQL